MIKFGQIDNVYVIGIGGIGISALARYFNGLGKTVAGYDLHMLQLRVEAFTLEAWNEIERKVLGPPNSAAVKICSVKE